MNLGLSTVQVSAENEVSFTANCMRCREGVVKRDVRKGTLNACLDRALNREQSATLSDRSKDSGDLSLSSVSFAESEESEVEGDLETVELNPFGTKNKGRPLGQGKWAWHRKLRVSGRGLAVICTRG